VAQPGDFDEEDVHGREPDRDIEITAAVDRPIQYWKYKQGDPSEVAMMTFQYTRYLRGDHKGELE